MVDKQQVVQNEGLFQSVDDPVIQQICSVMIQQERYHDLSLLFRTNKRFKNACQGLLKKEYERLRDQPPTTTHTHGTRRWLDTKGLLHRAFDLPAEIDRDGAMGWYQHGDPHREHDRPAFIFADGTKEWWYHGEHHREYDRPAFIEANGTKVWWSHDQIHRGGDRPAVIRADGTEEWYQHNQHHRDKGPAVVIPKWKINLWFQKGLLQRINNIVLPTNKAGNSMITSDQKGKQFAITKDLTIGTTGSHLLMTNDIDFPKTEEIIFRIDDDHVINFLSM